MGRLRVVDSCRDVLLGRDFEVGLVDSQFFVRQGLFCGVPEGFRLPHQVVRFFGCVVCDWKLRGLCPHNFRGGKGSCLKDNSLVEGICVERLKWLASFYRGVKVCPSFSEFVLDFNQGLAELFLLDGYSKLVEVEERLGGVVERLGGLKMVGCSSGDVISDDVVEFEALCKLRDSLREEWFVLWKELVLADSKRLDRDVARRVEVDVRHLSLSDIHRIMRGDIVDVDSKSSVDDGGGDGGGP